MLIMLKKLRWVYVDERPPKSIYPFGPESKRQGTENIYVSSDKVVAILPACNDVTGVSLPDADYCHVIVECGKTYFTYQIIGTADEVARKVESCGKPEQVAARELMDELDT